MVEVVSVFVAAGNGKNARAQNVIDAVGHQGWVARVRKQPRQLRGNPQLPLQCAEQQDAAISGDAPAVEAGNQLLAVDRWKTERRDRIVGHGGGGSAGFLRRGGLGPPTL